MRLPLNLRDLADAIRELADELGDDRPQLGLFIFVTKNRYQVVRIPTEMDDPELLGYLEMTKRMVTDQIFDQMEEK